MRLIWTVVVAIFTTAILLPDDVIAKKKSGAHRHLLARSRNLKVVHHRNDLSEVDRPLAHELDIDDDVITADDDAMQLPNYHHYHGKKKKKLGMREAKRRARESAWYHCHNGKSPKPVLQLKNKKQGVMCNREYPSHTCCPHHDLTVELIGSNITEQVRDVRCARFLMKLRCAHCSPRSWWLFHAPDKLRHPHKRMMPILCPTFCRKFQNACKDFVQGLQNDNFCDYHTSNEVGPCFPDYEIRRGTID